MTDRKRSTSASSTPSEQVLRINGYHYGLTKESNQSQTNAALANAVIGSKTQKTYSCFGDQMELGDVLVEMRKAGDEAVKGDLGRIERMLMNQALTLDTIFNNLAERATHQDYVKNMDTFLRLALKAQSQARATAETLSIVKNPMPYIKQANIAQGHQQVNNGLPAPPAHAGNTSFEQSKLLGAKDGQTTEWLDARAKAQTSRGDSAMATVGQVKRAKVSRG
jgi:hypothetical protein